MESKIPTSLSFLLACFVIEMEHLHIKYAGSDNSSGIEVSTGSYGAITAKAGDSPFLITTSALGAGVEYPSLRHVIRVDAPKSLVTYGQLEIARKRTVQSTYHLGSQLAEIVATVTISSPRN